MKAPAIFHRNDPLRRAIGLLNVSPKRVVLAVAAGCAALGSALGLAAVSAWLIARASQHPPILFLEVAVVSVRALGIGRGVFRYLERLASHEVALRGMANLRERLYLLLSEGRLSAVVGLRRGDLLARVGSDVDDLGDVVVRSIIPTAVAIILSLGAVVLVGVYLPSAGLALALCLILAGVLAPLLAIRSARTAEDLSSKARAGISTTALGLLDSAGELTVTGGASRAMAALANDERELTEATDRAAMPSAWSAVITNVAVGIAVICALLFGVPAVTAGTLDPVILAVIVLVPLAAFEAVNAMPGAAVQLQTSRAAARRIIDMLDGAEAPFDRFSPASAIRPDDEQATISAPTLEPELAMAGARTRESEAAAGGPTTRGEPRAASGVATATLDVAEAEPGLGQPGSDEPLHAGAAGAAPADAARHRIGDVVLTAANLSVGWPPRRSTRTNTGAGGLPAGQQTDTAASINRSPEAVLVDVDLTVRIGRSVAIVGPSGCGKTTLLLTLAGLIPPVSGTFERRARAAFTAEDAHVFNTSVLENLRVGRGSVTLDEALSACERAGLTSWLAGLPEGLDTMIGPDAATVSGGERRRLLLARALVTEAPIMLIDEPAEHLDPGTADALLTDLLTIGEETGRAVVIVTHRTQPLAAADEVIVLEPGDDGVTHVAARGKHIDLVATMSGYRDALD